jgi:voltage-gated potassium channel
MMQQFAWLAHLGELPQHESALAHKQHKHLSWLVPTAMLVTIPAFYLELLGAKFMQARIGWVLYLLAVLMLAVYLAAMLHACHQREMFIRRNWLDVAIALGLAASLFGSSGGWSTLEWLLRLALVALVAARILLSLRALLSPRGTLYILGMGMVTLALSGAGFYWLEPTVSSYADGLWLAFESGATVGYGDIVPTTPAARVFAVFMVLLGYALLSLVTASIAAFFVGEDEKQLRREFHRDIKELRGEVRDELGRHELLNNSSARRGSAIPK